MGFTNKKKLGISSKSHKVPSVPPRGSHHVAVRAAVFQQTVASHYDLGTRRLWVFGAGWAAVATFVAGVFIVAHERYRFELMYLYIYYIHACTY